MSAEVRECFLFLRTAHDPAQVLLLGSICCCLSHQPHGVPASALQESPELVPFIESTIALIRSKHEEEREDGRPKRWERSKERGNQRWLAPVTGPKVRWGPGGFLCRHGGLWPSEKQGWRG